MGEPIRILHVIYDMDIGGAETMIMNLYRNIDHSRVQFDFIVHNPEPCYFNDEIEATGGRIYCAPSNKVNNTFLYKKWWKSFFNIHKEYKIIHGHVRSSAYIYLKEAKKHGLITIIHCHSASSNTKFSKIGISILRNSIVHNSDYLVACSVLAGEWFYGKQNCKSSTFSIINNAINANEYTFNETIRSKMRTELHLDNKFTIGHVGRFVPAKNHEFLIDIFKEVLKIMPEALLLLVGDGELRKEIEEKADKLGIKDSVIFTGTRRDVPDILQAIDLFLLPSAWEGLPVSVIEAQSAGIPCIISDAIANEACITPYIKKLSLSLSPGVWAKEIIRTEMNCRNNSSHYIKESGFDIKETSKELTEFYEMLKSGSRA